MNLTIAANYGTLSPALSTPQESFSTAFRASTSVLTIFLIMATVAGNVLVILAFIVFRRIRTVINSFLVSLACADLCVALVSMPIWTVYLVTGPDWILHNFSPRIWTTLDILLGTASIMNLTVISFDRLLHIRKPMRYQYIMTSARVKAGVIFAWAYSFILALISYHLWHLAISNLIVSIFFFFLPLSFIITAYTIIFKIALHHTRKIQDSIPDNKPGPFNFLRELKAAKTLAVVVGAFVICWIPFVTLNIIHSLCEQCTAVNPKVIHASKWMHYGNSFLNPIIYAIMNRDFRGSFRRLLTHAVTNVKQEQHSLHSNPATP